MVVCIIGVQVFSVGSNLLRHGMGSLGSGVTVARIV